MQRPAQLDLPGVTPSRQKRSRETTAALLQAGAEMLRTHSLAELSIEALCRQVGATVGAFYSRFESKDAYFNALMALAAQDGESRLSRMKQDNRLADADLAELSRLLVRGTISWMRKHAPDQREAGRKQGIDRAEQQAADDHLNEDGGHLDGLLVEYPATAVQ